MVSEGGAGMIEVVKGDPFLHTLHRASRQLAKLRETLVLQVMLKTKLISGAGYHSILTAVLLLLCVVYR